MSQPIKSQQLLTDTLNTAAFWGLPDFFPDSHKLEVPLVINGDRWNIPTIRCSEARFNNDRRALIDEVMNAAKIGMFQVIDHEVPEYVMENAMRESRRFFDMPNFQINQFLEPIPLKRLLYTSSVMNLFSRDERPHFWRDCLMLKCDNQLSTQYWPSLPPNFTPCVSEFVSRVRPVQARLLELIREGLIGEGFDVEPNYFGTSGLNETSTIAVNRYPRCPQPTWAWGMAPHGDPSLMTISMQDGADGLQISQGDEWKFVVPSHNALLVTVGRILQMVSGNVLKAAEHRVVTNSAMARTSFSLFTSPTNERTIQPLNNPTNLSLRAEARPPYREFKYQEFLYKTVSTNKNPSSIIPEFRSTT